MDHQFVAGAQELQQGGQLGAPVTRGPRAGLGAHDSAAGGGQPLALEREILIAAADSRVADPGHEFCHIRVGLRSRLYQNKNYKGECDVRPCHRALSLAGFIVT